MKKFAFKTLLICAMLAAVAPVFSAAQPPASGVQKSHAAQAASAAPQVPPSVAPQVLPRFRFENFTTANGLPDNHVFSVLVDGDRIWAGTENGLAV